MRLSLAARTLPLLGMFALAACEPGRTTEPLVDAVALDEEDRIALDVIADADAVEAALALADVPVATAGRHRMMGRGGYGNADGVEEGEAYREQARLTFQEAVQALNQGDSVRARERAREARRLVVRAMAAVNGRGTAAGLVDRAEGLAAAVGQELGMGQNRYALHGELKSLATRARDRLQRGDSVGAGQGAVLAEQRYQHMLMNPAARPGGADVAVELGATSVGLATRLITEAGGPGEDQAGLLELADAFVAAAGEALAAGDDREAVHLADLGQWAALRAVVWPDCASVEEAEAIRTLAESRVAEAEAAAPAGVAAELLAWAQDLLECGTAALEETSVRGTGCLWRAAVIGTWILE